MSHKVIIFSAPSGSGKSTIVNHVLPLHPEMEFSISATSRAPRGTEQDGVEYLFYSADIFRKLVEMDKFVEYEEVYKSIRTNSTGPSNPRSTASGPKAMSSSSTWMSKAVSA